MQALAPRPPAETLYTPRLEIRKATPEFANFIWEDLDRDRVRLSEFMAWPQRIRTLEDELLHLDRQQVKWQEGSLFDFCIFERDSGQYLGNIGAHRISWPSRRAELGYWLASSAEGNGYMLEAVRHFSKTLFDLGFNRLEIRCNALNLRSSQVALRSGFKLEGRLREDSFEHGNFKDTLIYGQLRSEF